MKYVAFCACLGLCLALNTNNPVNTKPRRNILDGIASNHFGSVSFESITIRSNIAPESIIPSLPAGSNFGSSLTPAASPFLYSAESLGGIQNHFETLGAQHQPITIPVKSSDPINSFNPILNSNSPFDASLEIKPLYQHEAFGDLTSVHSASYPGIIPQTQLGYNNIKSPKTSSIGELTSTGKIRQQNTLSGVSASIERVPEVASFFKSGPLVPSDIPSVDELNKIFKLSEKSSDKIKELLTERSGFTKNKDTDTSNSNLQTNIIDNKIDGVSTLNQKNSNLIQLEQDSNNKNKSESIVQNNDSLSSNSESIVNVLENSPVNTTLRLADDTKENKEEVNTGALNQTIVSSSTTPTETTTILKQEVNTEALNQTIISNSTIPTETTTILQQEGNTEALNQTIIGNSTISIETPTLSQQTLSDDNNVSASQPIRKLDANSFSNVSDILKETSEINTTSQPEPVLLARIQIPETFNLTSLENKNETLSVEEYVKAISIKNDKEQSSDGAIETPTNQTFITNSTEADSLTDGSASISVSVKEQSAEPSIQKNEIEVRFKNEPESDVSSNSTKEKKAEGTVEVIKSCGCGKKHNVPETSPPL